MEQIRKTNLAVSIGFALLVAVAAAGCNGGDGPELGTEDTSSVDDGSDTPMDTGPDELMDTTDAVDVPDAGDVEDGQEGEDTGSMDVAADGSAPPCFETGTVSTPSCSEPSSCPDPDNSKDPEITCYKPQWVDEENGEIKLELYGKYLVQEDGSIDGDMRYRNADGGAGRQTDSWEQVSNCKVVVTLTVTGAPWYQCGNTLEFQLLRYRPTPSEFEEGKRSIKSDWHPIRVTRNLGN